jgi:predicted ATPase/DNA-binding CsgD family transcriptional regulator
MVHGGPLIGREGELLALENVLGSSRLVTVTGAGGCGKSRLALELTARVGSRAEPLPVWMVELASVGTAELVIDAVLRSVGARERSGRTPIEALLEGIAGRRALLVLDNCEHVLTEVGRLVAQLREGAPQVTTLLTSRAPLQIGEEVVFHLQPLGIPDAGGDVAAVVRSDAGRLFVDRAASRDPGFALTPSSARAVVRICRELDGLPLALTLAAARVDSISTDDIADALSRRGRLAGAAGDDALPHHRSLRASLDWSFGLLGEVERVALRRLSVFVGGWTVPAARAVALPEASESYMRGLLDTLEAHGLITAVASNGDERWTFLQTVGEYAAEQLALEAEREEMEERHQRWFAVYAGDAGGRLLEPDGHRLIDLESPNLRLALEHAIERDVTSAIDIVASLMRHWMLTERFEEASAASATVLAVAGDEVDPAIRALVHCGAGLVGMLSEDYAGAVAHTRSGLALLASTTDADARAGCFLMSSLVLIHTGPELEEGLRCAERAVELLRCSDDPLGLAWALVNLATADAISDRFDAARTAYEEFRTIPGAAEHVRLRIWAEHAAAWMEAVVGSPEQAVAHADVALALEGDWPSMTYFQVVCQRIHALARQGRAAEALDEGARALTRAHESHALMAIPAIELALVIAELMHEDYEAADGRARRLLAVPQLHTLALMREVLGQVALARADADEARTQSRELEQLAGRSGSARLAAVARFIAGSAAALDGEPERARDQFQAALATYADLGLERGAAEVLDELALLAASVDDGTRAARLAASAAAARTRLGCAPSPAVAARLRAARAEVADRHGSAAWDAAWAEGEALALTDAIAYARRTRGPRNRPAAGWGSLTPAELQVAQLAASGISNPQIASQLFMSRSTVKMHLSNVYMKLHIGNRTELAGVMAAHSADPSPGTDASPGLGVLPDPRRPAVRRVSEPSGGRR